MAAYVSDLEGDLPKGFFRDCFDVLKLCGFFPWDAGDVKDLLISNGQGINIKCRLVRFAEVMEVNDQSVEVESDQFQLKTADVSSIGDRFPSTNRGVIVNETESVMLDQMAWVKIDG